MIDLLKTSPLFENLNPEELEAISNICQMRTFSQGDQIIKAGDEASYIYLVKAGKVELKVTVYHLNAPVNLTLDEIGLGDVIGWSAIAGSFKYTISAYAVETSELIQIQASEMKKLFEENLHTGYVVTRNMAHTIHRRVNRFQGLLQHMIQKSLD